MVVGRREFEWGQTGSQMALQANASRGPRHRTTYHPWHFMPDDLARKIRRARARKGMTREQLRALKPMFEKGSEHHGDA